MGSPFVFTENANHDEEKQENDHNDHEFNTSEKMTNGKGLPGNYEDYDIIRRFNILFN